MQVTIRKGVYMLEEKGLKRLKEIGVKTVVTSKEFGETVAQFLERNEEYESGEVLSYSTKSYDEFLKYLQTVGIDLEEDIDFHIDDDMDIEVYIINIENRYFGVIVA